MKVLVASHSLEDFYFTPHRMAWLGARSLLDRLWALGLEAEFIDLCPPDARVGAIPFPSWLSHLKPFLIPGETGPFSFFAAYKKKSVPEGQLAKKIEQFRPDALVFSNFAYAYADTVIESASAIKARFPSLPIMAGGHGPSCNPDYFLGTGFINQVFVGPAEGLIQFNLSDSGVSNLLACPSQSVIPSLCVTKRDSARILVSGSFSRGCSHRCDFCANYLAHGRKFLTAELPLIEKKVSALPDAPDCHLNFEDDNLLMKKDLVFEILLFFQKKFSRFTFSFENGIDYRLLDEATLRRLHANGLTTLNLTLATAKGSSPNRETDCEKFAAVCTEAQRLGISSIAYVIGGLPGTRPEDLAADLIFLSKLPVTIGLSPFYPVPGASAIQVDSDLTQKIPGLCRSSSLYPWTPGFTTSDLMTAFRLSRTLNARRARLGEEHSMLLRKIITEKTLYTNTKSRTLPVTGLNQDMVRTVLDAIAPA
jgi:hypothetical protein